MYTEFVACNIVNKDKTKVFYLHKDKPSRPYFHGKIMSWGGHIEEFDKNMWDAIIRELKEELNIDISKEDLTYNGVFIDENRKDRVYFFLLTYENLSELYVKNEGLGKWEDINLHKTNPEKFLDTNLDVLDKVFSSSKTFEIRK